MTIAIHGAAMPQIVSEQSYPGFGSLTATSARCGTLFASARWNHRILG